MTEHHDTFNDLDIQPVLDSVHGRQMWRMTRHMRSQRVSLFTNIDVRDKERKDCQKCTRAVEEKNKRIDIFLSFFVFAQDNLEKAQDRPVFFRQNCSQELG